MIYELKNKLNRKGGGKSLVLNVHNYASYQNWDIS